ncbi:hypothetical protein [Streptomyces sp. NPDC053069]|uniref:hypothetical protein n=1 Tax=Streptomyces sp. NPDC053069 TaxID=3365695 RepID=UPI0037CEEF01
MSRHISTSLAALGLAAVGLLGTGAASAHAADPGCSDWAKTAHGASYRVCKGSSVFSWQVITVGASTDERFYIGGHDDCGHSYYLNWNDRGQTQLNQSYWTAACNITYGYITPTEATTANDGPEVYTP